MNCKLSGTETCLVLHRLQTPQPLPAEAAYESQPTWEFPKIGVPYFGVLIIRILLLRVLYLGPLFSETPTSQTLEDPNSELHFPKTSPQPATYSPFDKPEQDTLKPWPKREAYLWFVGNGRMVVIVIIIVPHSSIPY